MVKQYWQGRSIKNVIYWSILVNCNEIKPALGIVRASTVWEDIFIPVRNKRRCALYWFYLLFIESLMD